MIYSRIGFCIRLGWLFVILIVAGFCASRASAQTPVTTYHYDNNRTGWNSTETVLTPANVNKNKFGMLYSVGLDDQVDAQPLFVPAVNITAGNFQGVHDVIYIATENNTIYAIDSHSGTVLLSPNFGTPVSLPLGCDENGPRVGVDSTPVIDLTTNTLYVMFLTKSSNGNAYYLHSLDLGSLTDKLTPQRVIASHTLSSGATFSFNAVYQRQRPGLLLANGNIYAGFGSFCDRRPDVSRGWLLGWVAASLTPLAGNLLFDSQATAPTDFFLSSVWMSGYAPAADDSGNILVVTGNSDPSGTTYNGVTNIQESVIKLSPDLSTVLSLFTPMNQPLLDMEDNDFGAGGVLVLPDQPGAIPHLAVAAGKDGNMYLMNEDSLGGFNATQNNVLGTYPIHECYCGQSYYLDGVDGLARVVTSGGQYAMLWKLLTSPAPSLSLLATSPSLLSGQAPGFFTTISSNGGSSPIIWAVSHPSKTSSSVYLNAFNPDSPGSTMKTLFRAVAGVWPVFTANANIVPVVANGQVYVASSGMLQVFGLTTAKKR